MGLGSIINSITGASASAKQQNQYAIGMSNLNFKQQKEMLLNGPTWQMEGYNKAGVNPTYGLGGLPSGGGIASGTGGGSGGGLAELLSLVDAMNNTKSTNAGVTKTKAETNAIPQQLSNEATNAKANLISAEAAKMNAETNKDTAELQNWVKRGLRNFNGRMDRKAKRNHQITKEEEKQIWHSLGLG